MERIPPLKNVIGNYTGKQFTPADPIVVVGVGKANLITRSRPVDTMIDLNDPDSARGFKFLVDDNTASQISLFETLDVQLFRHQVLYDLQKFADFSKGGRKLTRHNVPDT